MSDQVDVQRADNALDVLHGELGVPAIVQVDRQWAQPQPDDLERNIRTVHAAAEADDAIVRSAPSLRFDLSDEPGKQIPGTIKGRKFLGELPLEGAAMVAESPLVKRDERVAGIHHATFACSIGTLGEDRDRAVSFAL